MIYLTRLLLPPLMILIGWLGFSTHRTITTTTTSFVADSVRLKKAMDSFRLEPGLRIELIAAEPLVIDPVALAFDENNRLYVVEDRGYPDPPEGGTPTRLGRVALLEDKDGDGKYDHRSEFVTGLTYPNGIQVWKGGVFVTCAPDVYYFKDTDGDGIADIKQVVLTGFSNKQTAQIRVSHPTLGLDGQIYLTSGLNSGEVTSPQHPDRKPVKFSASDSRFDPENLEFQTTGGRSQFGLTFDPYGRRFGCSNRHPVMQTVMEPWYLRRNPHLLFTETTQNVSKVEAEATVFPISGAITSADFIPKLIGLSHTGTFTSASGVMIYNGNGLTPAHKGNVFICESAQNIVQRQVMVPDGVSFKSQLPYQGKEFLASTDEWFRPVFLQHGPEGALYVADMHRKVIDHPSYVPEEARPGLDFESGKSDGRIYRIVRQGFREKAATGKPLFGNSAKDIVLQLESSEEWVRQTAHRLLLEKPDHSITPQLRKIALSSSNPESRTRALWLLNSYNALDVATIRAALKDSESGVREQAVRLSEKMLKVHPELLVQLAAKSGDASARVRYTTALVIGAQEGSAVLKTLADIAAKDGADRWVRAAVLSGISGRLSEFLTTFRAVVKPDPVAFATVMQDLGQLFGNGATVEDCRELLKELVATQNVEAWRVATALGLSEGISRRGSIASGSAGILYGIFGETTSAPEIKSLDWFVTQVAAHATSKSRSVRDRSSAAALLGFTDFDRAHTTLEGLMDARNPTELQLATISAFARLAAPKGAAFLTQKAIWSNYTPRIKSAVTSALVSNPEFIRILLTSVENGTIGAAEISSNDRQRLMKHKEEGIGAKAKVLFKDLEGGGRMKVYQDYRAVLELAVDAKEGKTVFEKTCSACHTYAGSGGKVGPDLTGVRNQPADALLLHILVPNYEVYPAYQAVSVETNDGRSLSGWLMAETDNSLTFKTSFGTQESILRKNIKSLSNSGLSLMPDGLEQTMTKKELAELIAYLKAGK